MRNPFEKASQESSPSAEEQEAFERRAALRRGGPEAEKIIAENREKDLAEGKEKDTARNHEDIQNWPEKRKAMEKQVKEAEQRIQQLDSQEKQLYASWRKNEDRQFERQSHTADGPRGEQGRALQELRNLRDMDATNLELVREERKKEENKLSSLRRELESGDNRIAALREGGF